MTASEDTVTIDVREMPPRERHPLIFETFDGLAAGTSMLLVNDHDPKPLYYQLMAEREGRVGWDYLESGPEVWQVRITNTGA
jgi:uncharacterized protein (DUF2249 family)